MRIKLSLCISVCCLMAVFQGCKKETNTTKSTVNFSIARILNNNMVIQRDKPFYIWGKADPNINVNIKVSWDTLKFSTVSNSSGDWGVSIPPAPANSNPQTITAYDNNLPTVTLRNILIGDVWICSGQSNMSKTMTIVTDHNAEISAANYPQIRLTTLTTDYENSPKDMLQYTAIWTICSPSTSANYSAVAYYFGQKLNTALQVPIGLVVAAKGDTRCEEWTGTDTINNNPLLSSYYNSDINSKLYNGMIYPLRNLSVKGFIWYQGESNRYDDPVSDYTVLNSAMIDNWRSLFAQGTLPFYFVQVAPYDVNYSSITNTGSPASADDYAKFREAQANVRAVPATGMAVTMDVGDSTLLHPPDKKPVGYRLALLALKYDYNQPVQCLGPQYLSSVINNNQVTISYVPGTADGLKTTNNKPLAQYFFVAGTDHLFRQGIAVINGNQVIITAPPGTPLPIEAIRYAFTNYPITNLQNSAGLPAEPFRTDDWKN